MKRREPHPLLYLLAIPLVLIVDLGILYVGAMLDERLFANAEALGHGIPVFTVIAMIMALVITVVVVILTIVTTIRELIRRRKNH